MQFSIWLLFKILHFFIINIKFIYFINNNAIILGSLRSPNPIYLINFARFASINAPIQMLLAMLFNPQMSQSTAFERNDVVKKKACTKHGHI